MFSGDQTNVRSWAKSGRHLLVLSVSQFDPTETFAAPERLMLSMPAFCSIKEPVLDASMLS
jgi:hypothetical protein